MNVSILKKPREEEWLMVKKAAFRTIGKDTEKMPSIEWKCRMLKAQHSPIRMLEYTFLLEDIPSWVSVHLVRHVHATPFVTTQRNDRMNREEGYDRRKAPQDTPVDMIWFVNAEELVTIAHKRLCMLASPETRKVVQDICKAVLRECPEWQGTGLLVPLCTYRQGACDEFRPCDYYMKHGRGYVNSGAALAKTLGIGTVSFDKEEIGLLLSAIDLYGFQDWIDKFCSDDSIRVMNKFIDKLRETDKMQLIIKGEE